MTKTRKVTKWCCPDCGGTNVEVAAWMDANTGDVKSEGADGPVSTMFCSDCEEHHKGLDTIEVEEPVPTAQQLAERVAANVWRAREARGLSVAELAKLMGHEEVVVRRAEALHGDALVWEIIAIALALDEPLHLFFVEPVKE